MYCSKQFRKHKRKLLFIILAEIFLLWWFNKSVNSPTIYKGNVYSTKEEINALLQEIFQFNESLTDNIISDRISSAIPFKCRNRKYQQEENGKVSIILAFHNEPLIRLLETIVSIFKTTPSTLLHEIVLMDDCSTTSEIIIHQSHPKINYIRNSKRNGLAQSNNIAATHSTGDYLMFLDCYTLLTDGWLEPLLDALTNDNGMLVSPTIDEINPQTFEQHPTRNVLQGAFDWSLNFRWLLMNRNKAKSFEDVTVETPMLPGKLLLINKKWFVELGGFDRYLKTSANAFLDISLKAWMCGGQIAIVPCSRIKYLNISHNRQAMLSENLIDRKRIAEIWLDDLKYMFYSIHPGAWNIEMKPSREIIEIQRRMQCRSFTWYLSAVFPELRTISTNHGNYIAFGRIIQGSQCLHHSNSTRIFVDQCYGKPFWSLIKNGFIMVENVDRNECLSTDHMAVITKLCPTTNKKHLEEFKWQHKHGKLIDSQTGLCLETNKNSSIVFVAKCQQGLPSQLWRFSIQLDQMFQR